MCPYSIGQDHFLNNEFGDPELQLGYTLMIPTSQALPLKDWQPPEQRAAPTHLSRLTPKDDSNQTNLHSFTTVDKIYNRTMCVLFHDKRVPSPERNARFPSCGTAASRTKLVFACTSPAVAPSDDASTPGATRRRRRAMVDDGTDSWCVLLGKQH